MRGLLAFLFLCLAVASATLVHPKHEKLVDIEFLSRQKNVYELFHHVQQPNIHREQITIAKGYSIESNMDKYTDPHVVKHFLKLYGEGMLPKGSVFSIVYNTVMHEAVALFELFYHAKDFETFYKTACWARDNVNEQMFLYAFTVAILHRTDCYGMKLPPDYEINPLYYFNIEVIEQAYQAKMQGHPNDITSDVYSGVGKTVVVNGNYSGWYINYNEEQKLSYFTEDIGMNSFYYSTHLNYPFWMGGEKYGLKNDRRGEIFYYVHQQLLARYYLERLTNGMGEIPTFSWNWPVETGYYPTMKYVSGLPYPVRPNHFDLKKSEHLQHLTQVEDYESRIREAIDQGYVVKTDGTHVSLRTPESIEYLANIIEGNNDSVNMELYRYSHLIARMLLGNSVRPITGHHLFPSALENYQTSLRDPMFYQLYKRYVGFFTQYKNLLAPYTKEELSYPGVRIENVEVDKLTTYFDSQDIDITNVLWQSKQEVSRMVDDIEVVVRQSRLNHQPFTVTINTVSEKVTEAIVRLYIGPKFDGKGRAISINENRLNFFELDQFVHPLKVGKNTIHRHSRDFWMNVDDRVSSKTEYKDVLETLGDKISYNIDESEPKFGYPQRFALPRGRKGGMPYYLYVIISPYMPPTLDNTIEGMFGKVGTGSRILDSRPLGYPFDRRIDYQHAFMSMNNMHFEDVSVYHKKEVEMNKPTQN